LIYELAENRAARCQRDLRYFALGHLLQLINHAQVTVGTLTIPMGVSWIALIVAAILCIWLWRLASLR